MAPNFQCHIRTCSRISIDNSNASFAEAKMSHDALKVKWLWRSSESTEFVSESFSNSYHNRIKVFLKPHLNIYPTLQRDFFNSYLLAISLSKGMSFQNVKCDFIKTLPAFGLWFEFFASNVLLHLIQALQ